MTQSQHVSVKQSFGSVRFSHSTHMHTISHCLDFVTCLQRQSLISESLYWHRKWITNITCLPAIISDAVTSWLLLLAIQFPRQSTVWDTLFGVLFVWLLQRHSKEFQGTCVRVCLCVCARERVRVCVSVFECACERERERDHRTFLILKTRS